MVGVPRVIQKPRPRELQDIVEMMNLVIALKLQKLDQKPNIGDFAQKSVD